MPPNSRRFLPKTDVIPLNQSTLNIVAFNLKKIRQKCLLESDNFRKSTLHVIAVKMSESDTSGWGNFSLH